MLMPRKKGVMLFSFAIGIVTLALAITFMYILPEYIISTLNQTGIFNVTQVGQALTKIDQIRSIGYVMIILTIIFMVVGVVGGRR